MADWSDKLINITMIASEFISTYAIHFSVATLALIAIILSRGYGVKKTFKIPIWYLFIGSDMGGNDKPYYVNKKGVCGAPDAIFFNPLRLVFVIGEYKSRKYNGQVRLRENYQVLLYMGLTSPSFLFRSRGYLCYGCGSLVPVKYDHKTYKQLLKLKHEVEKSKRNWKPVNKKPLHER